MGAAWNLCLADVGPEFPSADSLEDIRAEIAKLDSIPFGDVSDDDLGEVILPEEEEVEEEQEPELSQDTN